MEPPPNNPATKPDGAPFNAAIATLMRLDNIFSSITSIMQNMELSKGTRQHRKYDLVRQLVVQAMPLISNATAKKEVMESLKNIKPLFIASKPHKPNRLDTPGYSLEVEDQIDDLIIKVEETLQILGFFMPEKKEKVL